MKEEPIKKADKQLIKTNGRLLTSGKKAEI